MRALDMGRLQFNPFTADVGPVIAPIELEGFIGFEHQKHLGAASRRLLGRVSICEPYPFSFSLVKAEVAT